ncbi:MAG: hypothetical protein SRB1_02019 [Desulfobacteraceae bacterium Eth-SRB1]|nr:MAG: hypothetical protein SRB1_02019 [Desulfobacteraceae bacterium Eth-SRB1]
MNINYKKMDKINIACISEEIAQKNIAGNNIRLIKLLQYFPLGFDFTIFSIKNKKQGSFNTSKFQNVKVFPIDNLLYHKTKTFFQIRNFVKKILWYFINYYSTLDFLWAFKACKEIILKKDNFNFVFLQIPSLTNIIYGRYIKKRVNMPIIFDLRDDLINFRNRFGIRILENWMMKYGSLIVCVTNGSKEKLEQKYPQYKGKLAYIPNGYDPNDFQIPQYTSTSIKRISNIVYTGALYESRLRVIEKLFQVLATMQNKDNNLANKINFIFYTSNKTLDKLIESFGLIDIVKRDNIINNDSDYFSVLQGADYLLSLNMETPYSIPGKLYEYLAVNPNVIHIDNNKITEEVLQYFPQSQLILIDNIHDLINVFKRIIACPQVEHNPVILPYEYVKKFSRENIAKKYANLLTKTFLEKNCV